MKVGTPSPQVVQGKPVLLSTFQIVVTQSLMKNSNSQVTQKIYS